MSASSQGNDQTVQLTVFPDLTSLVESAALDWCDRIELEVRSKGRCSLALSGGRVAGCFLAALAETARRWQTPLIEVDYFWADERCVPPDHPESNFAIARQFLFLPAAIPPARIHRVRGEMPPPAAAALASAEMLRTLPPVSGAQPTLDLVFLGMGEDGHVASLFPSEPVVETGAIYRPVRGSKPPPDRVTLDYAPLAAAREVQVLISGVGKRPALEESLRPGGTTPLARLLLRRHQIRILTDFPVRGLAAEV